MNCKSRVASVGVAVLALGSICSAGTITGSDGLASFLPAQNGANLSVSTVITDAFALTSGTGSGDYAPIPVTTNYGPSTLDLNNFLSFSITNATYGSFVTTSGEIVTQQSNFLDVLLIGIYTPGPGLPGLDPTDSSLRISINQSGNSLSEAITLQSPPDPPAGAPEPATTLTLGGSLAVLGLVGRWIRAGRRQ